LAFLAFWHFGFWLSGSLVLAFWLSDFLAFWLFGFLAFWLFGILAFWLFGFLLFWLFWLSAPFVFLGTHSHSPPPPNFTALFFLLQCFAPCPST
jgi:hypothetical protein